MPTKEKNNDVIMTHPIGLYKSVKLATVSHCKLVANCSRMLGLTHGIDLYGKTAITNFVKLLMKGCSEK